MPPHPRLKCQICQTSESKYNCPDCRIPYCSFGCYKIHKEQPTCARTSVTTPTKDPSDPPPALEQQNVEADEPLRPLTSLKWPYVPEESAYPDPLKRDDPKVFQLPQYEAIATSVDIRKALSEHPGLKPILRSIDSLRGREREVALQQALGVSQVDHRGDSGMNKLGISEKDIEAMRQLSYTIEAAIRGNRPSALGLDLNEQ